MPTPRKAAKKSAKKVVKQTAPRIYSYDQLKGVIKVGDIVRAVSGELNACIQLDDEGSDTGTITYVGHEGFSINGCSHGFGGGLYLEIVNPKGKALPVKFITLYDGSRREFQDMDQVKSYIDLLLKNGELSAGETIDIYEIKSKKTATLETKLIFK